MPRRRRSNINLRPLARYASKPAEGLFKWASTDHSCTGYLLQFTPSTGFKEQMKYLGILAFYAAINAILTGLWVFFLIAFVIPYLLF